MIDHLTTPYIAQSFEALWSGLFAPGGRPSIGGIAARSIPPITLGPICLRFKSFDDCMILVAIEERRRDPFAALAFSRRSAVVEVSFERSQPMDES